MQDGVQSGVQCKKKGAEHVTKSNTPWARSGPERISVAYGNVPPPGLGRRGTKDKVPGILLGDFAERVSKNKNIGISVSIKKKKEFT